MNDTTQKTETTGSKPDYELWFVPENDKAPWVKVGAMWENSKQTGFNFSLEFIPRNAGRLAALPPKPDAIKEIAEMPNYAASSV